MSRVTWNSATIDSDLQEYENNLFRFTDVTRWRAILNLVDTASEAEVFQSVLDVNRRMSKQVSQKLHPLLAQPFEMRDPAHPSRFRGGYEPGVLYAAETVSTCALERGFHKVRVVRESPELILGPSIGQTLINFDVRTRAIDIRVAPYSSKHRELADPNSYTKSQEFGVVARSAGAGAIIYSSARGTGEGPCVAVLRSDALNSGQPNWIKNDWTVRVTREKSIWINSESNQTFEFNYV
jgi:hypothetical protein